MVPNAALTQSASVRFAPAQATAAATIASPDVYKRQPLSTPTNHWKLGLFVVSSLALAAVAALSLIHI